jgi:hypothetical protein
MTVTVRDTLLRVADLYERRAARYDPEGNPWDTFQFDAEAARCDVPTVLTVFAAEKMRRAMNEIRAGHSPVDSFDDMVAYAAILRTWWENNDRDFVPPDKEDSGG